MKKMLPWLITILLSITLIVLAIFLLSDKLLGDNGKSQASANAAALSKLSADEIVKMTSEITGIKTNLADPEFVAQMAFAFQLNDKKAKEEFDKIKEIKIKPIIIKTLADTKPELLNDSKGREQFIAKLQNLINKSLTSGHLIQIEMTEVMIVGI
ncbi:flagellar basal body-associated FliL family protein [Paenibacillus lautus]|jgi:flagellar FliL protein|uniref:Flagellar protein FliL n=1 Tax=Paenibacillus lautus TaxID=1401 RepID=A0A2A5LNW6_PAELA|nr:MULTISPECIES: flagellar basal body-associated FliL family protein [Paenibacillus]MBY0161020.1 flagellar basal body-associated FliL family protein [Cytobacillus firmus]ACX66407.1 flagellar basal body-associated protein FliL [Paenibacillus sp. Y412MC10]AYB43477.1 flagellar basal body protein FliL [Paenibacillus lautus]EGG33139.1 flagellar basal body-associated protein FliL [Paenibacillus sp. HGF5]ETT69517.1 flagellar basal body-associated protein FliL [Paenibacillus sp. FSL H8-457]